MPEVFACMNIGKMNFYGGQIHRRDRIAEGYASMGVGGGINDDNCKLSPGVLNPTNQLAFEIGLPEFDGDIQLAGAFANFGLDVGHTEGSR